MSADHVREISIICPLAKYTVLGEKKRYPTMFLLDTFVLPAFQRSAHGIAQRCRGQRAVDFPVEECLLKSHGICTSPHHLDRFVYGIARTGGGAAESRRAPPARTGSRSSSHTRAVAAYRVIMT